MGLFKTILGVFVHFYLLRLGLGSTAMNANGDLVKNPLYLPLMEINSSIPVGDFLSIRNTMRITTETLRGLSPIDSYSHATLHTDAKEKTLLEEVLTEISSALSVVPVVAENKVSISYPDLKAYAEIQGREASRAQSVLLDMYHALNHDLNAGQEVKTEGFQVLESKPGAYRGHSKSIQYFTHPYPAGHWALRASALGDPNFISILKISGIRFSVQLHPTDARGYRLLLNMVDKDMASTFNRPYTDEEQAALNTALSFMSSVYSGLGMTATMTAGNNGQSLSPNGTILMGNATEPSLLYGHVIGRGDPNHSYFGMVPLRGPDAGIEFSLGGKAPEPGNTARVAWCFDELNATADAIASALSEKRAQSAYYQTHIQVESIRQVPHSAIESDNSQSVTTDTIPSQTVQENKQSADNARSKQYFVHRYPADHWALKALGPGDSHFISVLNISGRRFTVQLNPTDARGYRLLISLRDRDMDSTFNRAYTDEEEAALNTAIALMKSVYADLGMTVDTAIAGNNSQKLNSKGEVVMGNEHEPSLLHGHVIGRGDPTQCYVGSVPLRGPIEGWNSTCVPTPLSQEIQQKSPGMGRN